MTDPCEVQDGKTLSDIARTLIDQVRLYERAYEIADDALPMREILAAAHERRALLEIVSGKMADLGLAAPDHGTMMGKAHKVVLETRAAVGDHDHAALAEVERGEDYLRDKLKNAIDDDRLCAHTRNFLQMALSRVQRTHSAIRRTLELV